ncbi:hypothetical protein OsccyDRAFT_2285 [Leptolyngbyaceae cyanobacterium JSC-12]|nr:hypothetical protein OsccyDRAFT_2285 [Leptolyngbyaceae cyanobacterium JSC-12]
MTIRWRQILASLCLSLLLFVTACAPQTSRYDQVQKETTQRGATPAVAKQAEQGATFNKIFPKSVKGYKGYEVVPTQEKKGFAEYKVKDKDGKTVAMLSISDTTSLPAAAAKYQAATETIAGYPTIEQGTTTTGILVNGYQVKVLSRDASFTRADRVAWLQKFDLKELAQLKPALAPTATAKPSIPSYYNTKTPTQPPQRTPTLTPQPAG